MRLIRLIKICGLLTILMGFRWYAGKRWNITLEKPTIWLELDEKLYSADGFGDKVSELTGYLEAIKNVPAEDQRTEILKIMLADFESVDLSFLRLRIKPGQIAAIDSLYSSSSEETYNPDADLHRTIKVKVAQSVSGASSGYASLQVEGATITGCNITIAPRTLEDPQFFIHVFAHEIMHCLGLEHQQDDSDSIMSYSNNSPRLSVDERMALTFLYPLDPDLAKEQPTFGLMCSPLE